MLYQPFWVWLLLLVVGWAGVSLGLFISAAVNRKKEWANLILPLVMMAQIVFSAQVIGDGDSLEIAYGAFSAHRCAVWPEFRADRWVPSQGGWLSERARISFAKELNDMRENQESSLAALPSTPEETRRIVEKLRSQGPHQEDMVERSLPNWTAAWVSYFTLSRHGDIFLRSFAYDEASSLAWEKGDARIEEYGYASWRWCAWIALVGIMFLLILLTMMVMAWQRTGMTFRQCWAAFRWQVQHRLLRARSLKPDPASEKSARGDPVA